MNKKRVIRNIVVDTLLILGYMYLYIADAEVLVNPEAELAPKATVNFIYQQF